MSLAPCTYEELARLAGTEIGVCSWIDITQERIAAYAALTREDGPLHVDPDRARRSPFGTTIAQGMLTVAVTGPALAEVIPPISDREYLLAYGWDRIRFLQPVRAGARIRGRFALLEARARSARERVLKFGVTVEAAGSPSPVAVGEWLLLVVLRAP